MSDRSARLGTFDIMALSATRYPSCGKICVPRMIMTGCACSTSLATADTSQCSFKKLVFTLATKS